MTGVPDQAPRPTEASRTYDLFIRHTKRAFWRMKDQGVIPEADRLAYPNNGHWGTRSYADIVLVNLVAVSMPRVGTTAHCIITFRTGAILVVVNATNQGFPDAERAERYYEFIYDLHQRLLAGGHDKHITFMRGFTGNERHVMRVALMLFGLMFVAIPLYIALVYRAPEALWSMLVGGLFVLPFWRSSQRNKPRPYDPKEPPDMVGE